jgi:hypothetical protein
MFVSLGPGGVRRTDVPTPAARGAQYVHSPHGERATDRPGCVDYVLRTSPRSGIRSVYYRYASRVVVKCLVDCKLYVDRHILTNESVKDVLDNP